MWPLLDLHVVSFIENFMAASKTESLYSQEYNRVPMSEPFLFSPEAFSGLSTVMVSFQGTVVFIASSGDVLFLKEIFYVLT